MSKTDGEVPEVWKAHWETWAKEVLERSRAPGELLTYIESTSPAHVSRTRGGILCCSPLREDKHPSFSVDDEKGLWHDFATAEGGDLVKFVTLYNHLGSFKEALLYLANHFGLPSWEERKKALLGTAPPSSGGPQLMGAALEADMIARWTGTYVEEERVFECMTALADLAHTLLPDQARAHLIDHYGLDDEYIAIQHIGYCPSSFWWLARDLPFSRAELLSTGWFHRPDSSTRQRLERWCPTTEDETEDDRIRPTFLDRIVFVYWKDSKARYAIGRKWFGKASERDVLPGWIDTHPWDTGKYRKLPTHAEGRTYISPVVHNIIWNEDCLRRARGGVLWITEGITDALILAMLGLFVISPVTIAFSAKDIELVLALLKRAGVARVVLCNDNDVIVDKRTGKLRTPGLEGAMKMASTLWAAGYRAEIVQLPRPEGISKIDLNEFVRNVMREGKDHHAA